MADVGDLNVQLKANDKASSVVKKAGANIGRAANSMSKVMAGASLAIAGAFALQTKAFLDAGDELHKMNQRTLISVKTLSALDHVAGLSGQNLQLFGVTAKMTEKLILGLSEGAAKQTEVVGKLGLAYDDVQKLGFEGFMLELLYRLADVDNEIDRGTLGVDVFKGAWTNLKNVIGTYNGKELKELIENEKSTTFWTLANATAAADFNDVIAEVQKELKQLSFAIVQEYLPAMKEIVDKTLLVIKNNKDAIFQTGRLTIQFAKIAIIMVAVIKAINLLIFAYGKMKAAQVLMATSTLSLNSAMIALRTTMLTIGALFFSVGAAIAITVVASLWLLWEVLRKVGERFESVGNFVRNVEGYFNDLWKQIKKYLIPAFKSYDDILDSAEYKTEQLDKATEDLKDQINDSIYSAGNYKAGLDSLGDAGKDAADKIKTLEEILADQKTTMKDSVREIDLAAFGIETFNLLTDDMGEAITLTTEQLKAYMEMMIKFREEALITAKELASAGMGTLNMDDMMKEFPKLAGRKAVGEAARGYDALNAAKAGSEFGQNLDENALKKAVSGYDTGTIRTAVVVPDSAVIKTNIGASQKGQGT